MQFIEFTIKDYIEISQIDQVKKWKTSLINNDLFHWEIQFIDFDQNLCKDCTLFEFTLS